MYSRVYSTQALTFHACAVAELLAIYTSGVSSRKARVKMFCKPLLSKLKIVTKSKKTHAVFTPNMFADKQVKVVKLVKVRDKSLLIPCVSHLHNKVKTCLIMIC